MNIRMNTCTQTTELVNTQGAQLHRSNYHDQNKIITKNQFINPFKDVQFHLHFVNISLKGSFFSINISIFFNARSK